MYKLRQYRLYNKITYFVAKSRIIFVNNFNKNCARPYITTRNNLLYQSLQLLLQNLQHLFSVQKIIGEIKQSKLKKLSVANDSTFGAGFHFWLPLYCSHFVLFYYYLLYSISYILF